MNSDKRSKKAEKEKKEEPDYQLFKLPSDLKEISGISFIDQENLLAVQDEEGTLYFYNLSEEKITDKRKFAGKGDYEDVVIVQADAYVISSDGKLFQIINYKSQNPEVKIYKTPLSEKNNIEGLAYDSVHNRLLLASKDEGIDNDEDKEIYAFDLKTKQLSTTPVYAIRLKEIENYFKGDAIEESSKKFLKAFGNKNLNEVFRPSAITINPQNKNVYVLSSLNNLIAVLNSQGQLQRIIELKGKEFIQPEGISFNPNGELFVSNEGRDKKANIIKLKHEN
ncbi:SdiA-regulated domain-containing protein [Rubrolithibacter danxiaensis]|uniref:SdiA-regulated domain-containing protein n=1 Tax=Rubrolithibacter danxiaensis TaxID=3390805 RepID=UPI003BF810BE